MRVSVDHPHPGSLPQSGGEVVAKSTESATGQRLRDLGDGAGLAASQKQPDCSLPALPITVVPAMAVD
ncbi:hypothetical protein [Embleya sp. NPDC001921]